jgi:hypothetical protein
MASQPSPLNRRLPKPSLLENSVAELRYFFAAPLPPAATRCSLWRRAMTK